MIKKFFYLSLKSPPHIEDVRAGSGKKTLGKTGGGACDNEPTNNAIKSR